MDPGQVQKFCELLRNLSEQNNEVRGNAEAQYAATRNNDPNMFIYALVHILAGDFDTGLKHHASVLARQVTCCTRDEFVWPKVSEEAKTFVKTQLLTSLEKEKVPAVRNSICNVVGELGSFLCVGDKNEWPELAPFLFRLVTSNDAQLRESALRVLIQVISMVGSLLVKGSKDALIQVLRSTMEQNPAVNSAGVRVQSVLLLCEIAKELPTSQWKHVQAQASAALAVVQSLCNENKEEEVRECLEALTHVAEYEPLFFKMVVPELVKTGLSIAQSTSLEADTRGIGMELVASIVEAKTKMVLKSMPSVPVEVVRACMKLMLELEDSEVAAWAARFADSEEEQDEEEIYDTGLTSLDRFAKALGAQAVLPTVFASVAEFIAQPRWQCKVAGLMTLSQVAEIVEEDGHSDEIMKLMLQFISDPHPRVRYAALHAIGQVSTDCAPHVQEAWHTLVIPALCVAMDDQVPRIGSHACSAFVNFAEECDLDAIEAHLATLMQKLFPRMQRGQPRQVRQEAVTATAVVAAVVESKFTQYYSHVMPVLKQIVAESTGQDERILRGKAFECLSLLGTAVGRDAFRADAQEAMAAVLNLQAANQLEDKEGTFKEFVHESCQRIASTLGPEFAQYLPALLPSLLNAVTSAAKPKTVENPDSTEEEDDTDEEIALVQDDNGNYRGIKTSQVQELLHALQTVRSFVESVNASFAPFVRDTAFALLPLLDFEFDEEVKTEALGTWAQMITLSDAATSRELLVTCATKMSKSISEEDYDLYAIEGQVRGLSDCLKAAPQQDLLNPQEVQSLITLGSKVLEESVKRRAENQAEQEDEDEDDKEDAAAEEDQNEAVRISVAELFGSLMNKHRNSFVSCGGPQLISGFIQKFLSNSTDAKDRSLALYFACDCLEYLGSASVPVWPMFMPAMLAAVTDSDPQLRQAACYGVNAGSKIPEFAQVAQNAAQQLVAVITAPQAKQKKNLLATENAIAALGWLGESQGPALGVGHKDVVGLWLNSLPLVEDTEEGQTSHAQLLRLVAGGLFSSPAEIEKVMRVFAQIYKKDSCNEATTIGIQQFFARVGRDAVSQYAAKFSQKEKNQIQRIFEKV